MAFPSRSGPESSRPSKNPTMTATRPDTCDRLTAKCYICPYFQVGHSRRMFLTAQETNADYSILKMDELLLI